ncbi:MAG: polymer-forming cytoskeletal family protein [Deltaproteobacteria bacterium]|nr:polymer-forming cytoskeletal family protein [Deltaproteobacteria bacterium]
MALWNQTAQEEGGDKPKMELIPAAPVSPTPAPREHVSKDRRESVFGPGVAIEGKIEGDADVRIAGKFKGDIQIKGDVNIEKGAHLSAKITAATVTIGGELEGNVIASAQIKLLESGKVIGDLKATTLTVAAGSRMRGHVEFGWSESEAAKFVNGQAHDNGKNGITK